MTAGKGMLGLMTLKPVFVERYFRCGHRTSVPAVTHRPIEQLLCDQCDMEEFEAERAKPAPLRVPATMEIRESSTGRLIHRWTLPDKKRSRRRRR